MLLREQDKHFLWSIYAGVAIIFVWKGIWEGAYEILPEFLADPFVSGIYDADFLRANIQRI